MRNSAVNPAPDREDPDRPPEPDLGTIVAATQHAISSTAATIAACANAARRNLDRDLERARHFLSQAEETAYSLSRLVQKALVYLSWVGETGPPPAGIADLAEARLRRGDLEGCVAAADRALDAPP